MLLLSASAIGGAFVLAFWIYLSVFPVWAAGPCAAIIAWQVFYITKMGSPAILVGLAAGGMTWLVVHNASAALGGSYKAALITAYTEALIACNMELLMGFFRASHPFYRFVTTFLGLGVAGLILAWFCGLVGIDPFGPSATSAAMILLLSCQNAWMEIFMEDVRLGGFKEMSEFALLTAIAPAAVGLLLGELTSWAVQGPLPNHALLAYGIVALTLGVVATAIVATSEALAGPPRPKPEPADRAA